MAALPGSTGGVANPPVLQLIPPAGIRVSHSVQAPTSARSFIACGMYNFSPATERAWRALFAPFDRIYHGAAGNCSSVHGMDNGVTLRFDSTDDSFQSPLMLLGQTCGYPLIKKWHHSHQPVSVPVFDIPGCSGRNYSSWFISHHGLPHQQLSEFAGTTLAINDCYSNSGMNVLRYGLSEVVDPQSKGFFASVLVTGSHHNSMTAVAERRAEIASIDAVSYYHLIRLYPELAERTRIVGQSVATPGLPFIVHKPASHVDQSNQDRASITSVLNRCLGMLDETSGALLRIIRFEEINIKAYQALQILESVAQKRGYGEIR